MIGHFLLTITPEEETLILEGKLGSVNENRCLLQTMSKGGVSDVMRPGTRYAREVSHWCGLFKDDSRAAVASFRRHHVGRCYDMLVHRFGVERVANAIRSRILTNQFRREMAQASQHEAAAR